MTWGGAGGVRLAADVGGTFTDVIGFDERTGALRLGKALSTPGRLVDGLGDGLQKADVDLTDVALFLHGSTVAINTILERSGAHTALVTTEGFRDSYEIGRVNRPESYNLFFHKHVPLIERALRFEVRERLLADGAVLTPLDERQLPVLAEQLRALDVEAVAIVFLHSYRNPAHELRAWEILSRSLPGVFITASHELSREYREFERSSTAAANAYIGPRLHAYLTEIERHLEATRFRGSFMLVQSNGGLYEVDEAKRQCIRMLESGPAAGVIGAERLCATLGLDRAIAFDMGGTTAKAGVIQQGKARTSGLGMIGRYAESLPIQVPMLEIHEVGTGGGSLAYTVAGGGLRVGPQSAGAAPGPACYGLGGERPTVTDANLALGRLGAESFLGGEMRLDVAAAERALDEHVAKPLGLTITEAADGILRVAVNAMANAVRAVTTARGLDIRDFVLVAYGGAGPLHAAAIARELRVRQVIIPYAPGHFSALGMLQADLRRDFVQTWLAPLATVPFDELERRFQTMEATGAELIDRAPAHLERLRVQRSLDMRYVGQEHAVTLDVPPDLFKRQDRAGIKALFDAFHETLYAFSSPAESAEIVGLRSTVLGELRRPSLPALRQGSKQPPSTARLGTRPVWFPESDGFAACPIYDRPQLLAGNRIAGPAVIEEHASTTIVLPGDVLEVHAAGHLVMHIENRGETA